ncbi:MAG: ATP-binding protein [Saprospiraceae bacterium]|nr:ATP-binding protein [Saprospiraceae bacterium]
MSIGNALDDKQIAHLIETLGREISRPENKPLAEKLSLLVKVADTQIEQIFTINQPDNEPEETTLSSYGNFVSEPLLEYGVKKSPRIFGKHTVYENGEAIGMQDFDFRKNVSLGTNAMLALGGLILKKLEKGGLVVFDELDNSLHPKISRFFIQLFHNPDINKGNAQIVFSTHEPLLMDKDMFRSDQIWFTEKNKFGESELYSAQDFDGVREDIPFDKWYMAGKFGALPNIQESLFSF